MPWLAAIGMLIVWKLVCRIFNIREFILTAASVIAKSLAEFRGPILEHSWWTLVTTLLGFGLAIVGGVLLGVAIGFSTLVYTGLYPLLVGFNAQRLRLRHRNPNVHNSIAALAATPPIRIISAGRHLGDRQWRAAR